MSRADEHARRAAFRTAERKIAKTKDGNRRWPLPAEYYTVERSFSDGIINAYLRALKRKPKPRS